MLENQGTRITVQKFSVALKLVGENFEDAEVECLLANMIYKGFIKGYISREKATVVLSAKDPFPKIPEGVF